MQALRAAGVSRVVLGLLHPLPHFRGQAVRALRSSGIRVDLLSSHAGNCVQLDAALRAALRLNEPLLHRVALGLPFSVWKYAMTLDGKIATNACHSAWISGALRKSRPIGLFKILFAGPASRERVFAERSRSDAVIIGGHTLRRDNPKLTTRREGVHVPARIVLSCSLDLPEVCMLYPPAASHAPLQTAQLWDTSVAPTIVMVSLSGLMPH